MRHPDQHPASRHRHRQSDTARLIVDTVPFHIDRGGRRIEATYSTRNGIVTVCHQGKSLSTYSPEADQQAVARKLLSVMLTI
ncbi:MULTISPECIES: hypothetical protein [Ralstonia solanacearum species complex]|uniref:Uncharacterized protein n=1 Tax=Ralstonia solanacearum K60 TaxID=1091042 RepID=A0AAP7ZIP2_RALSL|nr:hypothetical protein [Ralstonia solanacearum]OYQ09802.1 hypothetical protein B7R77_23510 [Ralstonia solanacearum K60]QOK84984.1 hypothetical protein HF906_23720 [Ralstonia solanacearum]RIJ84220.1 hypothetical protein RSP822_22570 [Ralstonia solanacearum]